MEIQINLISVLLSSVAAMALGFFWYGPLFGKAWMKLKGFKKEDMNVNSKEMGKLYGISFLAMLLTAYILQHVMGLSQNFYHYDMISTGMISAFWMWLGFTMPTQLGATLFGNRNWKLFALETGYQLAAMEILGFVIGIMY